MYLCRRRGRGHRGRRFLLASDRYPALMLRVGFVGFGEAGFHIAKGLREAGFESLFAFDIDVTDKVRSRAQESGTELVESNHALAAACDVIFSAVTADQALNAAEQ